MRISDAATHSGIPASTLRYYEAIGLVVPARSAAGYRDYDDAAIERLRAITAAKQVGLGLDDIAALLDASEHGSCAQTKSTLRPRLLARLADANRGALAVLATTGALQATIAHLDALPDSDEPCGADCALPNRPRHATATSCSLSDADCAARASRWRRLLDGAARTPLRDGVRVTVPLPIVGDIVELALAERGCCPFFEMALTIGESSVYLDVHAPAHAADLLGELFALG